MLEAQKVVRTVRRRESEAIETLQEEKTFLESIFFDDEYMYVFKLANNIEESLSLRDQSNHPLYDYLKTAMSAVLEESGKKTISEFATFYNNLNC